MQADMEAYLRRLQGRLGADSEEPIHVVLGGPEPDVDTVAATLCLALHLSQKETAGGVCLPLLCRRRCATVLPEDTVRYLQRVKICESLLLWREEVDLVKLHHTRKLSLTLLRDGLLDSSEYHALESSILRVVHHDGQQDAGDDGASSTVTTVAREILQEAAEHIKATLGEILGEALRLHGNGNRSAKLEELIRTLEQWTDGTADLEQLLTMKLKDFSDGEMTIALTSVTTDKEDWHGNVDGLKAFSHRHGLDGLVVLLSISDTVHHPRQQVVVYSNNMDILSKICCELEESSSWSLSGELKAKANFQVYHIPLNTPSSSGTPSLLEEEIQGLLEDFVDRRTSVLACHPSSRTSSTEGVAGSVEFSQGSSGINDMDGSDIERADGGNGDVVAIGRVMADGEEDTGGVGVNAGGELVSPDSGMTTICSSQSYKESSVFLSDDSPIGEVAAGEVPAAGPGGLFLRNPSPLLSLSPPVPPERRKQRSSRNRSDNFDLFSFDPLHSSDHSLPTGEWANSEGRGGEKRSKRRSSNLSELEELSLLDFSAPDSLDEFGRRDSSADHHGRIHGRESVDTVVPPTPVNSLVGSRPPSSCGVRFFPEDVAERINGLQHKDSVSSSLSETWDDLGFDNQGAMSSSDSNLWSRTKESESPQNIVEDLASKQLISDMTEKESWEEISKSVSARKRGKNLEPQLSLVTEQTESYGEWVPDAVLKDQWNPVTLADLQLTPPKEVTGEGKAGLIGVTEKTQGFLRKKGVLNTLTPDTSKEEEEGAQGKKGVQQMELLDFWTYSAQKGFLNKSKSESGTTTSYPESLDMWNMTIRDDSLSPLTTPDNMSENSGSFCGVNPNVVGATSVESPLGYTDGGMEMWNTTIQEDSSSTVTSPEGPENVKDFSHPGSLDAGDSLGTYVMNQTAEEDSIEEERDVTAVSSHTPEVSWIGTEHNVKIVIEAPEGRVPEETWDGDMQTVQSQKSGVKNLESEHSEDEISQCQGTNMCDLPVPGMVTSTSEYDNVGAGGWSVPSSPETFASPVVDMIQLEEQSSPFITMTKPIQMNQGHDKYQLATSLPVSQSANQVFFFEGTAELGHMTRSRGSSPDSKYDNKSPDVSEETDWTEHPSDYSPFVMVDCSAVIQQSLENDLSSPAEATETQIQTDQSLSQSHVNWGRLESAILSHDIPNKTACNEDRTATETQQGGKKESNGNTEGKIYQTMPLGSSSGGMRDALKCSPDGLQPQSRDELRSNSDGDSSSGLEMEYIVVSGTVKEAERERHDRPKQDGRQSKEKRKSMETFSTLFYAASVLQSHAQAAHGGHQENTRKSWQSPIKEDSNSQLRVDDEQSRAALIPHYQTNLDNAAEGGMMREMTSPSQSKNTSEAFHQSGEEENHDDKSTVVTRSVSPSLRYPSDHLLKTRQEIYVHSQISMEDSDEGGQSPSAPPPCPASLGDIQDWGDQLVRQDTPQTTSDIHSPVLTNSSVSHTSSSAGTPLSDLGVSTDIALGLPFSGDLMEEENENEEQEEEAHTKHTAPTKWTTEIQSEREERQQLESSDLLSFNVEQSFGSSLQQPPDHERHYFDGHLTRTVDHDKWSSDQPVGNHKASQDSYSFVLRHEDGTSQIPSLPTNEDNAYQWTGVENVTQGQTQYGYNYHHIDQRTEHQSTHLACVDTKSHSQVNIADVYAEFTTNATATQYRSDQADSYYEAGVHADYGFHDPDSKFQYIADYGEDSNLMCAAEPQYSQYQAEAQSKHETEHAYYQCDGQPCYQSDVHTEREDHARYVPEGYVHFLLSRQSQQRDGATGTMMTMAPSEEADEEVDKPADLSGGSNQRKKLVAPPMNVSLERGEGSLLSDTEDEALDTGDDLDVNIDDLDTPDEADSLDFNRHGDSEESPLGAGAASSDAKTGRRSADDRQSRLWRSVVIGEQEHRIDMKCIEPYKRVISHGGYYAEQNAIIVFAACFLPDSDCDNYNYVMENLFLYVISTLELMVAEDYMIVYLNGATPRRRMPGFSWIKKCYQMIDRRLKKNLKMFIIVHPSWFIRTLLGITRPFISSKFSSKIKYVNTLQDLGEIIPMDYVHIPPSIIKLDTDLQNAAAKADKKGNSAV